MSITYFNSYVKCAVLSIELDLIVMWLHLFSNKGTFQFGPKRASVSCEKSEHLRELDVIERIEMKLVDIYDKMNALKL